MTILGEDSAAPHGFRVKRTSRAMTVVILQRRSLIGAAGSIYRFGFSCVWLGLLTFMILPGFFTGDAPWIVFAFMIPFYAAGFWLMYGALGSLVDRPCVIVNRKEIIATARPFPLRRGVRLKTSRLADVKVDEERAVIGSSSSITYIVRGSALDGAVVDFARFPENREAAEYLVRSLKEWLSPLATVSG
jgi:hypothetical protein